MSKKHKHQPRTNKQGIPTFDHLKGPSRGIRLSLLPIDKQECAHLGSIVEDYGSGAIYCTKCRQTF